MMAMWLTRFHRYPNPANINLSDRSRDSDPAFQKKKQDPDPILGNQPGSGSYIILIQLASYIKGSRLFQQKIMIKKDDDVTIQVFLPNENYQNTE